MTKFKYYNSLDPKVWIWHNCLEQRRLISEFFLIQRIELTDKPAHLQFEAGKDERNLMRKIANSLLKFCQENGVSIVANQKVFDLNFIDIFLQNNILVLPRIGTQGMRQLQSMTKCSTILTSVGQLENKDFVAIIDQVFLEVKENSKSYIRLQKFDSIHHTLLVTHWNEDTCAELEVCNLSPFICLIIVGTIFIFQ